MEHIISISKYQYLVRMVNSHINDPSLAMEIVKDIMNILNIKYKET